MENYTTYISQLRLNKGWGATFKDLTDDQAGKLIKAVFLYTEGAEAALDDPVLRVLYKTITANINYAAQLEVMIEL